LSDLCLFYSSLLAEDALFSSLFRFARVYLGRNNLYPAFNRTSCTLYLLVWLNLCHIACRPFIDVIFELDLLCFLDLCGLQRNFFLLPTLQQFKKLILVS
jgi:hypothetical protein